MKIFLLWLAFELFVLGTLWYVHATFPDLWKREIVGDEPPAVKEAKLDIRRDEARCEGLMWFINKVKGERKQT